MEKVKSIEEEYGITDSHGVEFDIPILGSLGLLALGYRGLMAWRAKKIEADRKFNQTITERETGE